VKTNHHDVISFIVVYVFNFDAIASLIAAFKLPEQLPPSGRRTANTLLRDSERHQEEQRMTREM